jgi:hypothetical protein
MRKGVQSGALPSRGRGKATLQRLGITRPVLASSRSVKTFLLLAASILGLEMNLQGQTAVRFESGPAQVSLLELYTSEGCSSCPPAEAWLSGLAQNPALWKTVVPVAFHVDYWDNLGWKDSFSSREYTQRQRRYAADWGSDSVYTPAFVLNGAEWQAWGRTLPGNENPDAGKLLVLATGDQLKISYSPSRSGGSYSAEIVPLKMNATSRVTRGENQGRTLTHQFIAMNLVRTDLSQSGGNFGADIDRPSDKADALAVWVTRAGSLIPIQAVGGFLR